ncbi:restriction endonuclease [Candidatus Bathyarchaeota archaeon]|nr:MAG: restriction endonuclease [Candidatus Bathyarchaeota archaeon]
MLRLEHLLPLNYKNKHILPLIKLLLKNKEFQLARANVDVDALDGHQFESLLKVIFTNLGYHAINLQGSHDQGADLIIEKYGQKTVVQAKRYSTKVSNDAIQQAVAAIKYYKADRGMVITTDEFTKSDKDLAISNNIELLDRKGLFELMHRAFN